MADFAGKYNGRIERTITRINEHEKTIIVLIFKTLDVKLVVFAKLLR